MWSTMNGAPDGTRFNVITKFLLMFSLMFNNLCMGSKGEFETEEVIQSAITTHNKLRALHGSSPLTWDNEVYYFLLCIITKRTGHYKFLQEDEN